MDLDHLDNLCFELGTASRTFKDLYHHKNNLLSGDQGTSFQVSAHSAALFEERSELSAARSNLCGILTRLHTLFAGPSCFLQQIATQSHLLACLKWLGEFQVIACVPLSGSVSFEELADLANVPELILSRVVRMTATAGFLREVQPGFVAHTDLSAAFSTKLSYFDAAMFLSNHIAPSALHLTSVSRMYDDTPQPAFARGVDDSAYELTCTPSFASLGARDPRLHRQWSAYRDSIVGLDQSPISLLQQLDWQSLGKGVIVYTCATYTREISRALLQMSHTLSVIVQTYDSTPPDMLDSTEVKSRLLAVQRRKPTELQPVKDAAVYIVQPALSPLTGNGTASRELLTAELQSHLSVLRANPSALLIFAPTLLPEPDSVEVNMEVQARLRDFAHLLLSNESALEVTELVKLIEGVWNVNGKLVVTNRLRSASGATIALAVQHQSFA